WAAAGVVAATLIYAAVTVTVENPAGGCYFPSAGSEAEAGLKEARGKTGFSLLFPCPLPGGGSLTSAHGVGGRGQQSATMAFSGPFDMTLRQSQVAPRVSADPAGSTHITVSLFSNVKADLIERNDGSRRAEYHVIWSQGTMFYELLADGPPLSRDLILNVARSLQ